MSSRNGIRDYSFNPIVLLLLFIPAVAMASSGAPVQEESLPHQMANLAIQLSLILIAAHYGGLLFKRIKMPSVLGELSAGIILGPSLLGSINVPFLFHHGVFPVVAGSSISVQPELYGIATIGSILLLFLAGLETDLPLFARFSFAGSIVGIGGVIVSFTSGVMIASWWFKVPYTDPMALLLGVISTATSVGITVRVLSDKKKLGTPEGMTILAGAVVDDILGIIILAVVLGLTAIAPSQSSPQWMALIKIIVTSVGVWLAGTIAGLLFSHKISKFLKTYANYEKIAVQALGMALLLAGIFEKAGLAMVIGAYIMGLSLSRTDLAHIIEEALHPLREFFIPVFFVVMGMLVNIQQIASPSIITFGLIFTGTAIMAKIIGCSLPSLALRFNRLGALRIGLGMVPRGEVALIVAGIGLSSGLINQQVFSAAVLMTLVTTIVSPPLLNLVLSEKKGTSREIDRSDSEETVFEFENAEIVEILGEQLVHSFAAEGFYINTLHTGEKIHRMRKDATIITLCQGDTALSFSTAKTDTVYVKNMMYETLVFFDSLIKKSQQIINPDTLRHHLNAGPIDDEMDMGKVIRPDCIITDMKASNKEEAIREIAEVLCAKDNIDNKDAVLKALFDREELMSTGMENGIALPHGKTDAVDRLHVAIGIHREGIDFASIDRKKSQVIICAVSSKKRTGPHIRFLAHTGSLLNAPEKVEKLLSLTTSKEIYTFFINNPKGA